MRTEYLWKKRIAFAWLILPVIYDSKQRIRVTRVSIVPNNAFQTTRIGFAFLSSRKSELREYANVIQQYARQICTGDSA